MKTLQDFIDNLEIETSCKCNPNLQEDKDLLNLLLELKVRRDKDKEIKKESVKNEFNGMFRKSKFTKKSNSIR